MIAKIIVLVIGIALIGFISWWFFGKHEKEAVTADVADNVQEVTVKVDGGYSPETVVLKKGVPAVINFYRKDHPRCLEQVVFSDDWNSKILPEYENTKIAIHADKAGEYGFACVMNTLHGKVSIK